MGHSRPLFLYFRLFNTQLTVNKCSIYINFCRWLDSNRGPLVSEATALPTEPHNHCPGAVMVVHLLLLKCSMGVGNVLQAHHGDGIWKMFNDVKFVMHRCTVWSTQQVCSLTNWFRFFGANLSRISKLGSKQLEEIDSSFCPPPIPQLIGLNRLGICSGW